MITEGSGEMVPLLPNICIEKEKKSRFSKLDTRRLSDSKASVGKSTQIFTGLGDRRDNANLDEMSSSSSCSLIPVISFKMDFSDDFEKEKTSPKKRELEEPTIDLQSKNPIEFSPLEIQSFVSKRKAASNPTTPRSSEQSKSSMTSRTEGKRYSREVFKKASSLSTFAENALSSSGKKIVENEDCLSPRRSTHTSGQNNAFHLEITHEGRLSSGQRSEEKSSPISPRSKKLFAKKNDSPSPRSLQRKKSLERMVTPISNWNGRRKDQNLVKKVKKILEKGFNKKKNFLPSAKSQDKLMTKNLGRQLENNRLSVEEPEKMTCEELQNRESPRAAKITQWINSDRLILLPVIKNLNFSIECLNEKLSKKELSRPFTQEILKAFNDLVTNTTCKEGDEEEFYLLDLFMGSYEKLIENPALKEILMMAMGASTPKKGQKYIELLEKWNQFSSYKALKELHIMNWERVLKNAICSKKHLWVCGDFSDKVMELRLTDVVRSFICPESTECIYNQLKVNDNEVEIRSLKGGAKERGIHLFINIIREFEKAGLTFNDGETIEMQAERLFAWENPEKMDDYLPWKPLAYEYLLKFTSIGSRLMMREFMQKKFSSLFTGSIRALLDKGISCQYKIEEDHRGALISSATQQISFTVYPVLNMQNKESNAVNRDKPLAKFNLEWTGFNPLTFANGTGKEKEKENHDSTIKSEEHGYLRIIDYAFTSNALEGEKDQIMFGLSHSIVKDNEISFEEGEV